MKLVSLSVDYLILCQDYVKRQTRFVSCKPAKVIISTVEAVAKSMSLKAHTRNFKVWPILPIFYIGILFGKALSLQLPLCHQFHQGILSTLWSRYFLLACHETFQSYHVPLTLVILWSSYMSHAFNSSNKRHLKMYMYKLHCNRYIWKAYWNILLIGFFYFFCLKFARETQSIKKMQIMLIYFHQLFSFKMFGYFFIKTFSPQTRLEGISANKTGQFAVALEVTS